MKKVRVSIEEVLKYQRQMVIEIPDDMSEDELNNILDNVQRKAFTASDIPFIIEDLSGLINVLEAPDESTASPWNTEIEIDDFDFIQEDVDFIK